ncbi:MAG: hypothetical protein GY723_03000 [bacterium]|nr:hypothetical protein [bacterium]MCP5071105.1 hypothetical protein [bacterium]
MSGPAETIRPASVRLAEWFSVGPLGLALGMAGALLATLFGMLAATGILSQLVSGDAPSWLSQDFRVGVVMCLILAYLPAAQLIIVRLATRSLRELSTELDLSADELKERVAGLDRVDRRKNLWAGGFGLIGLMVIAFLPEALVTSSFEIMELGALHLSHRAMGAAIGFLSGTGVFLAITTSRRLSALTAERGRVDLLTPGRWQPLCRVGLGNAFVSAGVISLLLLLVPEREAGVGLAMVLVGLVTGIVILGGLGLVIPLRGVRDRIREAKRRELDESDQRISRLRLAWDEPVPDPALSGQLADAIAYRALIDDASEWPIDLPQLGRFGLVFGLPLLSWVAAALVERLIDLVIA